MYGIPRSFANGFFVGYFDRRPRDSELRDACELVEDYLSQRDDLVRDANRFRTTDWQFIQIGKYYHYPNIYCLGVKWPSALNFNPTIRAARQVADNMAYDLVHEDGLDEYILTKDYGRKDPNAPVGPKTMIVKWVVSDRRRTETIPW